MNNRLQLEDEDSIKEQKHFASSPFLQSSCHEKLNSLQTPDQKHRSTLIGRKDA